MNCKCSRKLEKIPHVGVRGVSGFGLRYFFVIRHWSFVLRVFFDS